jgi:class 3 adenylate cyclase/tetratricopeptide (TPR) repeat protein
MKCPRCQQENRPGRKFCSECGASLALSCPSCGFSNEPGEKFCGGCGTSLLTPSTPRFAAPESYTPKHLAERIINSKAALEGERKQVTVLFADLKGSMELLADRDPEEARKILDPVLELMMEAVHRCEGTVNQVMGDGIMALFGAPIGHEDHAVRACYAAMRMQEMVKRYAEDTRRAHGVNVQIRVGLNSGEVVVRAVGSDLHMDYTAVGQTTHLAARMEQLANPGCILLTESTLYLVEGLIAVKTLGPVPVRGLADAVEVYEVTGVGSARTRLQAGVRRGFTPFVGRDVEMEQLGRALQLASEDHGQVVAVVGEAGVGKSRLLHEFAHSYRLQEWRILEAASVSYGTTTSYLPVIELLEGYFKIQKRDDLREMREKITGRLLALDRALEQTLPAFLSLLDVPVDDPEWPALAPGQRRQRTLDAVKRLILREARQQPVLVIFEDLHWVDNETQAVLDALVESLPTARLLLLVNYRPEYRHGWGSKTYYAQVRLDTLAPPSATALLEALLGSDPALGTLKKRLATHTGGNALFLEESVRTLAEAGILVGDRGAYRLTRAVDVLQMPTTVQAILTARMDRLPAEEKHVLQAASVIGEEVPFRILQGIADVPEDTLRRALVHLQAAEFLYETEIFPDLEYSFKHVLTHQVSYGSLVQDRRRHFHGRIAAAMEQLHPDRLAEHAERLAYHTVRAGLNDKAIRYLREAGAKALKRSAYQEATEFLRQALTLLESLPETSATLREALGVRMVLGPAVMALGSYASADVEAIYRQALELCDRLDDSSQRFPVLWGLWYVNHGRGKYEQALELAQQGLSLARQVSDPAYLLEAHHSLWSTSLAIGEATEASDYCRQGLALYDATERRPWWLYGTHDPGVCGHGMLSLAWWLLGRPGDALIETADALQLARELQHPFSMMIAFHGAANVYYHVGNAETAVEVANTAVALGRAHGFPVWPERIAAILGRLLVEQGRIDEGLPMAEEAVKHAAAMGLTSWQEDVSVTLLAGAYGIAEQPDKGIEIIQPLVARRPAGFYLPEIYRIYGELQLQRSTSAAPEAEQRFRQAIHLARARRETSLELRAATSLARLLHRNGKRGDARAELAPVYASFTQGPATSDLRQARALLDEVC